MVETAEKVKYKGSELLLKCLEQEGVEYIFGIPGGVVLPIYDAIAGNDNIKHILTKHEQGAVHAAEGYAKTTGKVGVALTTSGPGATNIITGLTDAYYDSIPIVVFTGNVSNALLGKDAFQESDITSMTRACTKHNYIVRDIKDLASTVKEAFYIASTGKPGPVHVDITKDVVMDMAELDYPESADLPGYSPYPEINPVYAEKIVNELKHAKKPVILCGGGVVLSNTTGELIALSEKFDVPVASTLMGLGGFPADHPNFLGFTGMHGRYWANMAITNCDLLLILGARMGDRHTGVLNGYCPNAKIVHVDIDPNNLNKTLSADVYVYGDLQSVFKMVQDASQDTVLDEETVVARRDWHGEIEKFKNGRTQAHPEAGSKLGPAEVIRKVYECSAPNSLIATEVGQHQMWAAQYFNKNNTRSFVTSGGLGTMGFGLPAAIGAQLGNRDNQVVLFAGDGSIQMNIQEIATAVVYDLPVKIFVINNGFLGMVRQWQGHMFNRYSESKIFSPDYVKLAEAYGATGFRVENRENYEEVIKAALSTPGVVIVDCVVEEEDDVYPWVPVGNCNNEMLMEKTR